jgi:hypothetical protein
MDTTYTGGLTAANPLLTSKTGLKYLFKEDKMSQAGPEKY